MRIGMDAWLMKMILTSGLSTAVTSEVGCYAIVISTFIYQRRDITKSKTALGDVTISCSRISADIIPTATATTTARVAEIEGR